MKKNFFLWKNFSLLGIRTLPMALDRSVLQIASMLVILLLSQIDQNVLAQFSLVLSAAAIFFSLVTSIQLGIQREFARFIAQDKNQQASKLFWATLFWVTLLSLMLGIFAIFVFSPFSRIPQEDFRNETYKGFYLIMTCVPLVAWTTTLSCFFEVLGGAQMIIKIRIFQVVLQVGLVSLVMIKIVTFPFLSLLQNVVGAYIISDFTILAIMIGSGFKGGMWKRISFLKPDFHSAFLALKRGVPMMGGICVQRYTLFLLTSYVSHLGSSSSASLAIINSISFFFHLPLLGWSHAMALEIFQAQERKNKREVNEILFVGHLGAVVILGITLFFFLWFKNPLLGLFNTNPEILSSLYSLSFSFPFFIFLTGVLVFILEILRGYGDNMVSQGMLASILLLGYVAFRYLFGDSLSFSEEILCFNLARLMTLLLLFGRFFFLKLKGLTQSFPSS